MQEQVTKAKTVRQSLVTDSLNDNDKEFLNRLIDVIESRLDSGKVDSGEVVSDMNMSYSTLYRRLKNISDMTLTDFIKRVRIHKAESPLLTGKHSIAEIASIVGLNSASYFRECFKQEFGMSPTQWLNHIKGEQDSCEAATYNED